MNIFKSSALLLSSAMIVCSFGASANAASPNTEAFLTNVTANVDFLDRSSRLALENSTSAKIKEFARGEATEQTLAANTLYDITQKMPVQTGRSAAVTGQTAAVTDNRLPLGQEDLDSLEGQSGIEFDEAYRAKQRDALLQVQSDYEAYLKTGDDSSLKAMAASELPKVKKQLAILGKV